MNKKPTSSTDFDSWSRDQLVGFLVEYTYPGVTDQEIQQLDDQSLLLPGHPSDRLVRDARDLKNYRLRLFDTDSPGLIELCQRVLEGFNPAKFATLREDQMFYNRSESDISYANSLFDDPWNKWLARNSWSEDQAVAISLEKNPERVNWNAIKPFESESNFVKKYSDRRKLVASALRKKMLSRPITPISFTRWCLDENVDVPNKMASLLVDSETSDADQKQLISSYWKEFEGKTTRAIREYPDWRDQQTNTRIQKTGSLVDWLKGTIKANSRESEIIKKVLSDIYPELR
jgi:hypothetical protein